MHKDTNEQHSSEPILIDKKGLMYTYMNPVDGSTFTELYVLEIDHNVPIKKYTGVIRWKRNINIYKQIVILKRICPRIKSIPDKELIKIAKNTEQWEFGVFFPDEAEDIKNKAIQDNLDISMIEIK